MTHTLDILRTLNHETFTSGAQIAQTLGITRASVSLALQRAEHYGVELERRVGVGYRLLEPIDWLDVDKIQQHLAPIPHDYQIQIISEVDSTNNALLTMAEVSRETVLATEWQGQGRGRRGRAWEGVVGGSLMFSIKKVFPEGVATLSGLSLAVGVAMIRALTELGVNDAALKWPNDLVCEKGKLGGVLIEVTGDALGPSTAVIGIGLNIKLPQKLSLTDPYTDLCALGFQHDRNTLLGTLLNHLYQVFTTFEKEGLAPFLNEWEKAHCWQGKAVKLLDGQREVLGTALGITKEGALRLLTNEGEKIIMSGDISLRGA